jgi:hypothetical protein
VGFSAPGGRAAQRIYRLLARIRCFLMHHPTATHTSLFIVMCLRSFVFVSRPTTIGWYQAHAVCWCQSPKGLVLHSLIHGPQHMHSKCYQCFNVQFELVELGRSMFGRVLNLLVDKSATFHPYMYLSYQKHIVRS